MGPKNEVVILREATDHSWVDRMYHKLEAMCVEVDKNPSLLFQETTKYMENQMNVVGKNVRNFCTDLIQDLLPPSSLPAEVPVKKPDSSGQCHCDLIASEKSQPKAANVSLEITEGGMKDQDSMAVTNFGIHSMTVKDNTDHLENRNEKETEKVMKGCVDQRSSDCAIQKPLDCNAQIAFAEELRQKRFDLKNLDASATEDLACCSKDEDCAGVIGTSMQQTDEDEEQSAHWLVSEEDRRFLKSSKSTSTASLDCYNEDPKGPSPSEDSENDWEFI